MKTAFTKADKFFIKECSRILGESELGQKYFVNSNGKYIGAELLKEGFENDDIYVTIHENGNEVIAFSWILKRGIFNWFPFLHVMVVSKPYRCKGYGKEHLKNFEQLCIHEYKADKGFLMVADSNTYAKNLYLNMGYKIVGTIPSLLIEGINEVLMYKEIF